MRVYIFKRVEYILAGGLENFWSMKPPLSFGVFVVSSVNETSMVQSIEGINLVPCFEFPSEDFLFGAMRHQC